jgi:hypothetical protein
VTFAEGEATLWPGIEKYRAKQSSKVRLDIIEQSSARYKLQKSFAAVYDGS